MTVFLILTYVVFICIASAIVFAAFRLWKKYQYKFLNYFLYYIMFFCIYGFLTFNGRAFVTQILQESSATLVTASLIISLIAAPALLISIYLLILWVAEILEKTLPNWLKVGYWLVQVVLMSLFFYVLITFIKTKDMMSVAPFSRIVSYTIFAIFFASFLSLLIGSRNLINVAKKRLARNLGWIYLGVFLFQIFLEFITHPFHDKIVLINLFMAFTFFLINTIPLSYIYLYLNKHRFVDALPVSAGNMKRFIANYNITGREKEIIEMVIEGMSNKDISHKLFISIKTVKSHMSNIYMKTSVKNRVQLSNLIRNVHQ